MHWECVNILGGALQARLLSHASAPEGCHSSSEPAIQQQHEPHAAGSHEEGADLAFANGSVVQTVAGVLRDMQMSLEMGMAWQCSGEVKPRGQGCQGTSVPKLTRS